MNIRDARTFVRLVVRLHRIMGKGVPPCLTSPPVIKDDKKELRIGVLPMPVTIFVKLT